jgi:hypothetical protein
MPTFLGNEVRISGTTNARARMRIEWQLAGQEYGNNRSLINWQAYVDYFSGGHSQLDDGYVGWNGGGLYDNPGRVHNWTGSYIPTIGMGSGSFWVGHDGNGNASFSMTADVYVYQSGRTTANGSSGLPQIPKPPHVQTYGPNSIVPGGARLEGNVSWNGGAGLSQRGFVWGTSPNPGGNAINVGGDQGAYGYNLTGLQPNTLYYYRAYAVNSQGITYGGNASFTTGQLPEISTGGITGITGSTANAAGVLVNNGNPDVTEKGFVYATSQNPTTANNKVVVAGAAEGAFSAVLNGLTPSTTYYVRAFATNAYGTVYGSQVSFGTVVQATVTTQAPLNITTTGADARGNIISNGGGNLSQRGFVYGLVPTVTLGVGEVGHTELGPGAIGPITDDITGLTPSTIYYVRAYATNEAGTGYGAAQVINTIETPPLQPTLLDPTDGEAIDDPSPTLTWKYNPGSANDTQGAYQVQLVRESDSHVMFDTGKITGSEQSIVVPYSEESPDESPADYEDLVYNVDYQWRFITW